MFSNMDWSASHSAAREASVGTGEAGVGVARAGLTSAPTGLAENMPCKRCTYGAAWAKSPRSRCIQAKARLARGLWPAHSGGIALQPASHRLAMTLHQQRQGMAFEQRDHQRIVRGSQRVADGLASKDQAITGRSGLGIPVAGTAVKLGGLVFMERISGGRAANRRTDGGSGTSAPRHRVEPGTGWRCTGFPAGGGYPDAR